MSANQLQFLAGLRQDKTRLEGQLASKVLQSTEAHSAISNAPDDRTSENLSRQAERYDEEIRVLRQELRDVENQIVEIE